MEANENLERVGAEVCAVLKSVPSEEYNKVSKNIRNLFERYISESKKIKIDTSKSFDEQSISKEAKDIIFVISFNYWLTEEQKKVALKKLKQNEIELNQKYDIERIFKSRREKSEEKIKDSDANSVVTDSENKMVESSKNKAVVKSADKWYKRILAFFRRIFRRK
ncbi:MAG: hypothetical protein IKD76_06160 [Clostridia bacterium]|nr:hypothetical protein [Clostridia bacterium]